MKAKARLLKHENVSGESKDTGKPYSMDFAHFLDVENFDKIKLLVRGDDLQHVKANIGKDGLLEVSVNPKTDKLDYASFRVAA